MLSRLIFEAIRLLFVFISVILIFYTALIRLLFLLFPDSTALSKAVLETDIRFNLILLIFLLFTAWIISVKQGKLRMVNPLRASKEEQFSIIISAIFIGYYIANSFSVFDSFRSTSFILLAVVCIFILFQVIELFKTYSYEDMRTLKHHVDEAFSPANIKKQASHIIFFVAIVMLVCYSIGITFYATFKSYSYRNVLKDQLYIESIHPKRTTYGYQVTLTGYNFGPEYNRKRQTLESTYGPVLTSFWSENRIEFTVPLQWKVGHVSLWIERPNMIDERRTVLSNNVDFEVLNRWEFYPTATDSIQDRVFKRALRTLYLDYWNNLSAKFSLPY